MTSEALDGQLGLQSCYTVRARPKYSDANVFRLRLNRAIESYSTKYQTEYYYYYRIFLQDGYFNL